MIDGRLDRRDRDRRPAAEGDERHAIVVPALANLHSHAFQRAMAGLAETARARRPTRFWTWRETMYRFALTMTPDDVEAVAAQLYVEMLEAGFAAVAEFHYLHHAPDGAPYANRAEMAARIVAAARETGIGLTLLPVFYAHGGFGGAPPTPQQRRFVTDIDSFARSWSNAATAIRAARRGVGVAPHTLRAATPANFPTSSRSRRRSDPHPCRRADEGGRRLRRVVRRAAGALAPRPRRRRPPLVPRPRHPYGRGGDARSAAGRARSRVSARSPKPISATA